jgi:hypothetical protein
MTSLETTDIFREAFFLCSGGRLADVRFAEDRRTIATFLIEGEDIDQLDLDYRNGQALVNPLLFRETLNHLRDILFKKLREAGRYENDRKRKDRAYKARC